MAENFKPNQGLTLIELIVNITIIGILAAIAIPAYNAFRDKARTAQAKSDLRNIQLAMEQLANDTNQWPGPREVGAVGSGGVWDLNSAEAGLVKAGDRFPNWKGPYMKSVPKDPWGPDYFFDPNYNIGGTTYAVIGSFGPNRCCQGAHDADNVIVKLTEGVVEKASAPAPAPAPAPKAKGKGAPAKGG